MNKSPKPKDLNFSEAITETLTGRKISRREWKNENIYGILKDDILMLYRDNKYNSWVLSEGDLTATDWFVVDKINES